MLAGQENGPRPMAGVRTLSSSQSWRNPARLEQAESGVTWQRSPSMLISECSDRPAFAAGASFLPDSRLDLAAFPCGPAFILGDEPQPVPPQGNGPDRPRRRPPSASAARSSPMARPIYEISAVTNASLCSVRRLAINQMTQCFNMCGGLLTIVQASRPNATCGMQGSFCQTAAQTRGTPRA